MPRMTVRRSRILDAISALQNGNRREAAILIRHELKLGEGTGDRWASVSKLAMKIGEIDMAIEASRRFALTEPIRLDRLLGHCEALAQVGRSEEAQALLSRLPARTQNQPGVLHFRGTIASETGDFEMAEALLRQSLDAGQGSIPSWFSLAMIKTFELGDEDFEHLARQESEISTIDPSTKARYYYAMGKALVEMGEIDEGFEYYDKGASLRRNEESYDQSKQRSFVDGLIRDFTRVELGRLQPSDFSDQRSIFVNGLPRSGTTLVESILVNHSRVADGAELNLVQPSLIPTGDCSFAGAMAYQQRTDDTNPWGAIARDYHYMLAMRFREGDLVVDKTVNQSFVMGLLLHSMPSARVVWLRRRPDDVALSAYRTFFTSPVPWSWSFEDIAYRIALEDRLFEHWSEIFPERIFAVSYEKLVSDPDTWIPKIVKHVGLEFEPGLQDFHQQNRLVRTASVKQVRSAISTHSIGKSEKFGEQLQPFRDAYARFSATP